MARPKLNIDWKKVDAMLEADCEGSEVAAAIGIHPNTLYERCKLDNKCGFSEYLQQKKAKGNSLLKEKQFEAATTDKDRGMMIWLGKQRLGQKDKQDITSGDKPIDNKTEVVFTNFNGIKKKKK